MPHHLLGVAEIAAMLGLTRQRVNQLVQSADFPTPEAELSAGRIWSRRAIETWVAAHPDRATEAGTSMFGQFTDGARAVVIRAQEEARKLRHDYIGTEHLLLALLSQAAPGLRQRLASIGIDREGVAADIASSCPPGEVAPVGHIPFTPRSKSVLTNAASAASGAVEARHIAHAVVRMSDGLAAELMRNRTQLDQDELVAAVDRAVGGSEPAIFAAAPPVDESLRCSFCGNGAAEVQKLIAGPGVYICDACIDLCNRIIADEPPPEPKSLATRVDELAAELDRLRRDIEASG